VTFYYAFNDYGGRNVEYVENAKLLDAGLIMEINNRTLVYKEEVL